MYPRQPDNAQGENWAIYFRSDSRNPLQIFTNGFQPADGPFAQLQYRERSAKFGTFDVAPATGISMSSSFGAAAMFPNTHPNYRSWIYVMHLPESSVVNVQADQLAHAAQVLAATPPQQRFPLNSFIAQHAQERAAQSVPRAAILGAVEVDRRMTPQGQQFQVLNLSENPNYRGSPELLPQLRQQVLGMSQQGWLDTPRVQHGLPRTLPVPGGPNQRIPRGMGLPQPVPGPSHGPGFSTGRPHAPPPPDSRSKRRRPWSPK